ncbi:MAG: helix-turn-helix transcriptional regulator, partial [Acidimicrobiia bacterium]|nr:helix-turn-helix transcriptional regulator [Acidimicrobiia bacterium]
AGMTQAELAEQVGVEPVSLSRWETGSRSPSITVLYGIAQALGVGVGDLVDEDGRGEEGETGGLALERVMARASAEQRDLVARIAMEVLKRA